MNLKFYMLDKEHNVIMTKDVVEWGTWFEDIKNRRVDFTEIDIPGHKVAVSTVCIGIPRNILDDNLGIFETMINSDDDGWEDERHCATWDEAVEMHEAAVKEVRRKALRVVGE